MTRIRKHLTYANVVASLALFLVLAGGGAVAASQLGKNSVGTRQLKKDAVTGAKIKDGAVTGADMDLGTLGTVPSAARSDTADRATTAARADAATRADSAAAADAAIRAETAAIADSLAGQITFSVRLGIGQQHTVATNGAVSIVARCSRDLSDAAELMYATSVNGAVAAGQNDYPGSAPDKFLNVNTPPQERTLIQETTAIGRTFVGDGEEGGFVVGPEGKGLVVNNDATILAINHGGLGCRIAGFVHAITVG